MIIKLNGTNQSFTDDISVSELLEDIKWFPKDNYIYFTNIEERRYELYSTPLIGLFSGLRRGDYKSLF